MGRQFTNTQRDALYTRKGEPILALEFDVFPDGNVSMWAHTRHDIPFPQMRTAFEAIAGHLASFLADGDMCPFNPDFRSRDD